MIYLYLSGGLGNQLFQYAYARAMQKYTGDSVTYLEESYKTDELRDLSLNKFDIAQDWVSDATYNFWNNHKVLHFYYRTFEKIERIRGKKIAGDLPDKNYIKKQKKYFKKGIYVHENHAYIAPDFKTHAKDKYIRGLWHHPMYFDHIKETLIDEFCLKDTSVLPAELISDIQLQNSVCDHIRRGDYVNYSYYIVCDIDYYNRAIEEMRKQRPGCRFFVFSDDIVWVKENIKYSNDITYVEEPNPDYIDFELMRNCKHFIISNSTFSWWAAYLGQALDKLVMTPDRWYNDGRNKEQLNLPEWMVMKTN